MEWQNGASLNIHEVKGDTILFVLVAAQDASFPGMEGIAVVKDNKTIYIADKHYTPLTCDIHFELKGDSLITVSLKAGACGNNQFSVISGDYLREGLSSVKLKEQQHERLSLSAMGFTWTDNISDVTIAKDMDNLLINCLHHPDHGNTMSERICFYEATDTIKKIIEKEYQQLYSKLDNEDKLCLKKSQDAWSDYFAKEHVFLSGAFVMEKYHHGSGHTVNKAQWGYQVARQRLIALRVYESEIHVEEE